MAVMAGGVITNRIAVAAAFLKLFKNMLTILFTLQAVTN